MARRNVLPERSEFDSDEAFVDAMLAQMPAQTQRYAIRNRASAIGLATEGWGAEVVHLELLSNFVLTLAD